MTTYVLLTDDDNGTTLVACPDEDTAEQVGAAAIWSSGGVSAWRVPNHAVTDTDRVVDLLREGKDCSDLDEEGLPEQGVQIKGVD